MNKLNQVEHNKNGMRKRILKAIYIFALVFFVCLTVYFSFLRKLTESTVAESGQSSSSYLEAVKDVFLKKAMVADDVALVKNDDIAVKTVITKKCVDAVYVEQLLLISDLSNEFQTGADIAPTVSKISAMDFSDLKLKELVSQIGMYDLRLQSYYYFRNQFEGLYRRLIVSLPSEVAINDWFYKYLYKMISIRKVGERALNDGGFEARLEQVKIALDNGDLQQAFDLMNSMPEAQKEIAGEWLLKLGNFLHVKSLINEMYSLVTASQYRNEFLMVCSND